MAMEIERKFLIRNEQWRECVKKSVPFKQGYLTNEPDFTTRIRREGEVAKLTIKYGKSGISRKEFEYEIPLEDAEHLFDDRIQNQAISKTRHYIEFAGKLWELDEFHGDNQGLLVAEIELESESEEFEKPDWLGDEVSSDSRYQNSVLLNNPYNSWPENQ